MARDIIMRDICMGCEAPITENQSVCDCGTPTHYMTFEERNAFEVQRYRRMQETT